MHPLFHFINEYATISEAEFKFFLSNFIQKEIPKKYYLLEQGETCKYMAFIVEGAMRQYYIDEKGVKHIVNLHIENSWAVDRESFVIRTPAFIL